jgi:hypothetical protein
MANLLCLLFGHKKSLVPFSSNRYYCGRCGLDLGVDGELAKAPSMPPAIKKRHGGSRLHR